MFKNVASQKVTFYAFTPADGLPKTGDAGNLTAYVSKDDGSLTALTDTSAAELDSTNGKGLYTFDLTQSETNADKLVFSCKSSTSGVVLIPFTIYTVPPNFTAQSIDSNGRLDVIKVAGTTQSAGDIFGRLRGLVIAHGTIGSTGNTTTTLHLTGLTFGDDELNNCLLVIYDASEAEYHSRWINDWANTGDLATVATLPFTPQNDTDTYWILPRSPLPVMIDTKKLDEVFRCMASALLGLGGGGDPYRSLNDSKDRVTYVAVGGSRTTVTLDGTE